MSLKIELTLEEIDEIAREAVAAYKEAYSVPANARRRTRYQTDPEYRELVRARNAARKAYSAEWRAKKRATDPEFKARDHESSRRYYETGRPNERRRERRETDPEFAKRAREDSAKMRARPGALEEMREYSRAYRARKKVEREAQNADS